jgi:uncharacterized membrane protein
MTRATFDVIIALNRARNVAIAEGDDLRLLDLAFLMRAAHRAANRERMNNSATWAAIRDVVDASRHFGYAP